MLAVDSKASLVSKASTKIIENYSRTLPIKGLAKLVAMSPFAFHSDFTAVTGTPPTQFQKQTRLIEARRLLMNSSSSVTEIAYNVG